MFHATIVIGFFWTSRSERTPQNPFIQSERKRLRFDVALTLRSAEMQALRDYVTAADGYRYANQVSRFEMESWRLDLHSKVSKDKDIGALFSTPELHHWSTAEAASTLRLDVTHSNLIQRWHDLVFDSNMSVRALRLGKDIWGSWDHVWTIIVIHSIYTYVYFIWRHLKNYYTIWLCPFGHANCRSLSMLKLPDDRNPYHSISLAQKTSFEIETLVNHAKLI